MDHLEEILPLLIPILALSIPIIVVLSRHQLRMTQILNSRQDNSGELMQIRQELASLRDHMNRHALAIDNLEKNQRSLPDSRNQIST